MFPLPPYQLILPRQAPTLLGSAECGRASRSTVVEYLPGSVEWHVLFTYCCLAALNAANEFGRLWSMGLWSCMARALAAMAMVYSVT